MKVLAMQESNQGIAECAALFAQSRWDERERLSFFLSIIQRHINAISQQLGSSMEGIDIVVSGMASSSIGMFELPYKHVPFSSKGEDLLVCSITTGKNFKHPLLMISGAASATDVMRGEETQLVGAAGKSKSTQRLFIFPGTHSKHVMVRNDKVPYFETFMTGEFFALLSSKSMLSSSVHASEEFARHEQWFRKGVADGAVDNLLQKSFLIRVNDLFEYCSREENYFYLSGLLIGTELKDVFRTPVDEVVVVCNEILKPLYLSAWQELGLTFPAHFQPDDEALIMGQLQLQKRGDFQFVTPDFVA